MITKYTNAIVVDKDTYEIANKQVVLSDSDILGMDEYQGDVDTVSNKPVYIIPKVIGLDLSDFSKYNVFDLTKIEETILEKQLNSFDVSKSTFMYIKNPIDLEQEYDIIVPFCKKHNIKLIVCAGRTLDEMGRCDKLYNMSPIDYLEECGVLNLEPIVLSCANLEKSDFEKLSYYNATICLDITNDWISGNGLAHIPSIIKYNLNVIFNGSSIIKELEHLYFLASGYYKIDRLFDIVSLLKFCTKSNSVINSLYTMQSFKKHLNYEVLLDFSELKELFKNN